MSTRTPSSDETLAAAAVGAAVFSADGEQFGRVRETRGGYFKVDVPWATDYWLSTAYVARYEGNEVWLAIPRSEIDEHRLEEPGLEPSADPHRATTADAVISDEEALAQRERMERELAEQRERRLRGDA
ncbi:MAG: hypothetical protein IT304_03935 [Dehalococcoidia bacterium]|nr:hypothetical protein [Dehalococcoidia bacterium]